VPVHQTSARGQRQDKNNQTQRTPPSLDEDHSQTPNPKRCTQIFRRSSSDGEVPELELLPIIGGRIK